MASGDRSGRMKSLGPGLVWAAAAVGVSHLVQSTRAGASYGFALVAVVLLANLLKYPFFEFGPRYAAATGESLIEGYRRQGRWVVVVYLFLTLGTMFAVEAAVTFVTGSLATQLFGDALSPSAYAAVMLGICALILIPGRYPFLDAAIKAIMAVLTVTTLVAVAAAVLAGPTGEPAPAPAIPSAATFAFLIALFGWMPSAIDISVWHSLWTLERARQTRHRPRLAEVLFDFNLGYAGTVVLAVCFLTLGALILHRGGEQPAASGAAFAAQLISLYTEALGPWSRPVIALAAFTTMFSTTLTVTDAFPRVLQRTVEALLPRLTAGLADKLYWVFMLILIGGGLLVIGVFTGRLTLLVDVATTLSFLTAPVLSWFNFRAVTAPHVPAEARPPRWLRILAWVGLVFGGLFALVYLGWRLALA